MNSSGSLHNLTYLTSPHTLSLTSVAKPLKAQHETIDASVSLLITNSLAVALPVD